MTSNIGQEHILTNLCGRQVTDSEIERCTQGVMQQLKMVVRPEFLNRIDKTVMFLPLSKEDVAKIAEINLKKEQKKFKEKGVSIIIDPGTVKFIVDHGYQPEYGGRPVKRAITDHIINPLTSEMVNGTIEKNAPIYILVNNNKVIFRNGITSRF